MIGDAPRGWLIPLVVAAAGAAVVSGCTGPERRGSLRAEIGGPEGTDVRVVTSTAFVQERPPASDPTRADTAETRIRFAAADTLDRTLPATISRQFTESQRFYIEVSATNAAAAEADGPLEAEIRLFVDGEEFSRVQGDLLRTPLEIVYRSFVTG